MKKNKKLVIVSNEKISINKSKYFCKNIDMKSIPEGLNHHHEVNLIACKNFFAKTLGTYQIKLNNIKIASNIFTYLFYVFRTFKKENTKYLIISITPHSFLSYILLFFFNKKVYVYLRSNGYEEYKAIFGHLGSIIYHVMYYVVTFNSKIITCQKRLVKNKKYDLVLPSELDKTWFKKVRKPKLDKPRLLYVGRIKVEKGIFSLINILDEFKENFKFSIVGSEKKKKINKNFFYYPVCNRSKSLIKFYDKNNIFILPSFTEAHPKVIDESLARVRPVIIFNDIKHIVKNRKGIFISKRNIDSLNKTIKYILNNYSKIQRSIKKNKLPTKEKYIKKISSIFI